MELQLVGRGCIMGNLGCEIESSADEDSHVPPARRPRCVPASRYYRLGLVAALSAPKAQDSFVGKPQYGRSVTIFDAVQTHSDRFALSVRPGRRRRGGSAG